MTEPSAGLTGITHRDLDVRGLRMHIAEAGSGPLVLLLHGLPESWYSLRDPLPGLRAGRPAAARLPRVVLLLAAPAHGPRRGRLPRRRAGSARVLPHGPAAR